MPQSLPMTSKQRLLAAMSGQPVDHLPLMLRFWWMGGADHIPFPWQDQVKRVENTLARGLDDTLLLEPPLGYVEQYSANHLPDVSTSVRALPAGPGEDYPRLTKIYQTPAGPLQTTVKVTADWPHGEEIPLFDDYNLARLVKPLIQSEADLPALACLLGEPSGSQVAAFQDSARALREQAGRLGVVLDGGWTALGDAAMWLCGMERILYAQLDDPDFVEGLLDTILDWELHRMDRVMEAGAEVIVHSAWYEGTDFWSPRSFRRYLKPRLAKMVANAHRHGVKFRYIITKGWKPLRQDLVDIGVDCITGVDPMQDRVDLSEVKAEIGARVCLMGGVNSALLFSPDCEDAVIRQAVDDAVGSLAPGGGFILYPVDAVFTYQPWDKVQVLIDRWREICARG